MKNNWNFLTKKIFFLIFEIKFQQGQKLWFMPFWNASRDLKNFKKYFFIRLNNNEPKLDNCQKYSTFIQIFKSFHAKKKTKVVTKVL